MIPCPNNENSFSYRTSERSCHDHAHKEHARTAAAAAPGRQSCIRGVSQYVEAIIVHCALCGVLSLLSLAVEGTL